MSVFVLINYILLFTMAINIFQAEYKLKKFPWPNPHTSLKAWMWLCSTGVLGVGAQVGHCFIIKALGFDVING